MDRDHKKLWPSDIANLSCPYDVLSEDSLL